jgi:hypothetical protein
MAKCELPSFILPVTRGLAAEAAAIDLANRMRLDERVCAAQVWALCATSVPPQVVKEISLRCGKVERMAFLRAVSIGFCSRRDDSPFEGRLTALMLAAKLGLFSAEVAAEREKILAHGEVHLLPLMHGAITQDLRALVDKSQIEEIILEPKVLIQLLEREIAPPKDS